MLAAMDNSLLFFHCRKFYVLIIVGTAILVLALLLLTKLSVINQGMMKVFGDKLT